MISAKEYFIVQVIFLIYVIHMSHALQCKTCEKNEQACLLGHDVESQVCTGDTDVCYSWFDRSGSLVGVQRGCISSDMPAYRVIKKMIGGGDEDCVKRVNGLDCFKFCSLDHCN